MVKRQRCCSGTTKGSALSTMFGFLLLTHEIIVVFKKSKLQRRLAAEPPKAANWINKSVPCRTEGVDRRYSHGTIWTVPDGALGDASTYINEQFTYLYGVRGTSCKIIKSRLSFLPVTQSPIAFLISDRSGCQTGHSPPAPKATLQSRSQ